MSSVLFFGMIPHKLIDYDYDLRWALQCQRKCRTLTGSRASESIPAFETSVLLIFLPPTYGYERRPVSKITLKYMVRLHALFEEVGSWGQ